jgi:hypothetical protein
VKRAGTAIFIAAGVVGIALMVILLYISFNGGVD